MCGRFTLTTPKVETLAELFTADLDPRLHELHRPRFNIAPTSTTALLTAHDGQRRLEPAVWGLPSTWGEDRRPGGFINARSETAATSPAFRDAFARGRCGVLADGFYEWAGTKAPRLPLWFHPREPGPLVLGAIFRDTTDADTGEVTRRFAILTTRANSTLAPYHERMPVIVPLAALDRWLGQDKAGLTSIMAPAADDLLVATPVATRVNNVRFDDPACLAPR